MRINLEEGEPGRHCPNSPDNGTVISHWKGDKDGGFGRIDRADKSAALHDVASVAKYRPKFT